MTILDITKDWEKDKYAQDRLTEYRFAVYSKLKTPESWLRFAKYYLPKYIRKRLLIPGYKIANKDHWQYLVFRTENNLTRNEYIGYNSKSLKFRIQVVYFVTLYEKNRAATIIQRTFRLWGKCINAVCHRVTSKKFSW